MKVKRVGRPMRSGSKEPNPNFTHEKKERNRNCARWKIFDFVLRTEHLKNKTLTQNIGFLLVVLEWSDCLPTQEWGGQVVFWDASRRLPLRLPSCLLAPLSALCFTSGHKVNVCLVCWVAPDHHITAESQKHGAF